MADHNVADRRRLQAKGQALPPAAPGKPPRFPLETRQDFVSAVHLVGQAPEAEQPAVRRYIMKNARKLGFMSTIPDEWNSNGTVKGK